MNLADIAIVVMWVVVTSAIGIWAGLRSTLEGFWANERATGVWRLVFTIVATQVGGGTVIGICSSSYAYGTGFGLVAVISTVTGFLAVAFLAPWAKDFGDKHHAYTLPEVFALRYGRRAQLAAAVLIVIAYLSLLGGQFLSVGVLLETWTGWDAKLTLLASALLVIFYSAFAGLKGDIITDAIHFWTKALILFFILLPCIWVREPLLNELARVPSNLWSPVTFGGMAYVIAGILLGALIPIVSMEMWMRVYAAVDRKTAKKAFIWSAVSVIPFYLLPLILGLAASQFAFVPKKPDSLLIELIFRYVPHIFLGVCVAGILAVVVSAANTMIIVIGAVLYRDVLRRRGDAPGDVRLSRWLTFGSGVAGFGLALAVPDIVQIILNAFFIVGMLAPPLLGIVIWRRATGTGAFFALLAGGAVTVACLPSMPKQAFLPGLVVSIMTFVLVSLVTKHRPDENLEM